MNDGSSADNLEDVAEKLKLLTDEDNIRKVRKKAETIAAQFTIEHYNAIRRFCKTSNFFLGYDVLGFNKLSAHLHGNLASWMLKTDPDPFRLCLLPRGHLKTTFFTVTDSIRCALPDDVGDLPWPECLGTDIRIMIGHETDKMASRILSQISGHFLDNPVLLAFFPECLPGKKQKVNLTELELPHKGIWQEPTFDSMGVGARSQGKHYPKIKLDDIIGKEARESKTIMEGTNDWLDNIQSFFVSLTEGELDITGTRWAYGDSYQHLMDIYGDQLKRYIRGAIEKDKDGLDQPIYPESFTLKSFEIIKKNPAIWSAQYANDPALADSEFLPQWVKFFNRRSRDSIFIMTKQPPPSELITTESYNILKDLDRVVLIDPAPSGPSGIVVTGMATNGKVFTLEAIKQSLRPPELVDKIFKLVLQYQPRTVAIEEVLFSEIYRHWLLTEMQVRQIRFHITPVKTKNKAKELRIRGLTNYYAAGILHHDPEQKDLLEEIRTFGASIDNKHLLDAFAYGPEVWVKPWIRENANDKMNQEQTFVGRDPNTGY